MEHLELIKSYTKKYNRKQNLIEFGCGDGTKLFLDNCNTVKSIEFYAEDKKLANKLKISTDE